MAMGSTGAGRMHVQRPWHQHIPPELHTWAGFKQASHQGTHCTTQGQPCVHTASHASHVQGRCIMEMDVQMQQHMHGLHMQPLFMGNVTQ